MRIVTKITPQIITVLPGHSPGDVIGIIMGLVSGVDETQAYGSFDYRSTLEPDNPWNARVLRLPRNHAYRDLSGASKSNMMAVGFRVIVGTDRQPHFKRYEVNPPPVLT